MKSRGFSGIASAMMLGVLFIARPDPLSAQCAKCVRTSPWPGSAYCAWGPWANGGGTYCEVLPGMEACIIGGDCEETFVPFAPDGSGRGPATRGAGPSTVLVSGGGVQVTRGCGGIIVKTTFTAEVAHALRKQAKRVVV